jgi:hypothetical protein
MKKYIPLMVLVAVVLTGIILFRGNFLQTQVLNNPQGPESLRTASTVEDCKKLSQNLANRCFLKIALEDKDASICDQISRPVEKQRCERQVQITR